MPGWAVAASTVGSLAGSGHTSNGPRLNRGEAGASLALPADAVVLSADDAADLSDRVYQVRCAAEDVATALDEGAGATELRELCDVLIRAARAADGWRRVGV